MMRTVSFEKLEVLRDTYAAMLMIQRRKLHSVRQDMMPPVSKLQMAALQSEIWMLEAIVNDLDSCLEG